MFLDFTPDELQTRYHQLRRVSLQEEHAGLLRVGPPNNRVFAAPESTSPIDGGSAPKKSRAKRHVFTPLEKEILVNLYNTNKLKDKKDIHDVVLLLSKDDRPLSETQVKTWVDNYKASLNRKKQSEKDTDPKDKDQE